MSCNSRKRQLIVTLVNLSHSSFTVRRYTTVKEVRWHSKRGKATVAGVVGIVTTMPCCDMGVAVSVTSQVRAPCVEILAPRRGLERCGVDARPPEGSGEAELVPEAGVGRAGAYARRQGVRASRCPRPSPGHRGWFALPFAIFIALIWVSFLWYPTAILSRHNRANCCPYP